MISKPLSNVSYWIVQMSNTDTDSPHYFYPYFQGVAFGNFSFLLLHHTVPAENRIMKKWIHTEINIKLEKLEGLVDPLKMTETWQTSEKQNSLEFLFAR
jgi:hypothetical protein